MPATPATPRLPFFDGPELPLFLAPMAGFTDYAFRELCKAYGADVMVTEFVMANKFLDERSEEKAWRMVDFTPGQRPMGVQIFGGEPDKMAEAADRIADRVQPDFIDINYGCPAPKVVNNCAGSSLLRDPCRLQGVAEAVVRRVTDRLPVTAKIRIGWDKASINAVEVSRRLENVGIEAVAVHGRTKEQGYSGDADWDVIEAVADALRIPVIGNGSIRTVDDVRRIRTAGKVQGLMVGRRALGNPFLFREIKHALLTGKDLPPPTLEERWEVMLRYGRVLLAHREQDPWDRINWMRPRLKAFARNFPGSKNLRRKLESVQTLEELQRVKG
ncbi:MAG: tRNA dihydrouridine synthase DusB [Verrucomicrobia bacterium]|jgi:nifR3 family TIM-barrel protein|nr:tRNA dihydrouridine synthase DusB [Verrucomicrobiota bacterium]